MRVGLGVLKFAFAMWSLFVIPRRFLPLQVLVSSYIHDAVICFAPNLSIDALYGSHLILLKSSYLIVYNLIANPVVVSKYNCL